MPAPQERDLNKATEDFKNWLIMKKIKMLPFG